MKELFVVDLKNYDPSWPKYVRPSSRAVIVKDGKLGLIYSPRYQYYKFAGGGIEENESSVDALIREVEEEAGYRVIPSSIKEYGIVRRIEKDTNSGNDCIFIQDNYYYFCDVSTKVNKREMDDYEKFEGFTFRYVEASEAIKINETCDHGPKSKAMIERETRVLKLLNNI